LWKRYPDRQAERAPFIWTILLFVLMFIGLALAVFSYIIPLEITIYEASTDLSSLVIRVVFTVFLIPVIGMRDEERSLS
jgi:cytochrome bd ubiquinol oxidase subunit II